MYVFMQYRTQTGIEVSKVRTRAIEDKLFLELEPLVDNAGVRLLDVEFTSQGKIPVIRIYIYRSDGVSLDDCVRVQNICGDYLDREDPVPGSYTLEVSSPGLERALRRDYEFELFRGRFCQVNLFRPVDGKRMFRGYLDGLAQLPGASGGAVALETEEGGLVFDRANVSKVKLLYDEGKSSYEEGRREE